MPKLIKDGVVATDQWQLLTEIEDGSSLPAGNIIIPVNVWLESREALAERKAEVGVWLNSDELADTLGEAAAELPLIALNFPTFMDGRGFSTARLLRDAYGFSGELRAIGGIIRDQLFYLKRCGFDSFSLADDIDAEAAIASFSDFSETYQGAEDQKLPLFRRRG
ncbi:MAG: DUF934 domain-containing protein [Candidatus Pelagadaptatus aseana]|uniref:DUF934 domain-containing protein n=1 Tax=Candidatus Pelagadaptatus aseana TaxID=3120508 RepID=UPI0039B21DAF